MTVKLFPNPGDYFRSASSEFMGKTFQAAQLTHERFLTARSFLVVLGVT